MEAGHRPLRQARHPVPSRGWSGRHRHRYGKNPAGGFSQTLGYGIVPKAYLHSGAAQSCRFSRSQAGRSNAYACRLDRGATAPKGGAAERGTACGASPKQCHTTGTTARPFRQCYPGRKAQT
nr:hypothetical protein [uncultured Prevotella sp.]